MTTTKTRERMAFAVTMARQYPDRYGASALAEARDAICRLSVRHCRLQEARCNRQWTDADEQTERRIEGKIAELATEIDPAIRVQFEGDPRGCTVKLVLPSGFTNDFAGEGVCVPQ